MSPKNLIGSNKGRWEKMHVLTGASKNKQLAQSVTDSFNVYCMIKWLIYLKLKENRVNVTKIVI